MLWLDDDLASAGTAADPQTPKASLADQLVYERRANLQLGCRLFDGHGCSSTANLFVDQGYRRRVCDPLCLPQHGIIDRVEVRPPFSPFPISFYLPRSIAQNSEQAIASCRWLESKFIFKKCLELVVEMGQEPYAAEEVVQF
jgi:hypothetical protein